MPEAKQTIKLCQDKYLLQRVLNEHKIQILCKRLNALHDSQTVAVFSLFSSIGWSHLRHMAHS